MQDESRILFTGSQGLLGGEIMQCMPQLLAPTEQEFDITDYAAMEAWIADNEIDAILHAAAFTSPPKIDEDPLKALEVNIVGTANVVRLCANHALKCVYICTDYVFKGDQGNYREDDPVYPVNKYAWSKLGGECAVRLLNDYLIIRTTFGPNEFPFPKAFVDQWTSRESVSTIAQMICRALRKEVSGVLHIGGPRKTVYDFARQLSPDKEIGELYTSEVDFDVPKDTSLDTTRYQREVGSCE